MRLAELFSHVIGDDVPVEIVAYDGSKSGPREASVRVVVRSPLALSYFGSAPGELGLARAYVAGELDVVGDLFTALSVLPEVKFTEIPPRLRAQAASRMLAARLWWPVGAPPQEARPRHGSRHSRRHTRSRDSAAISHHYDISNEFYAHVLGPSMTYTCAVYPCADADLELAQFTKHDLVARKLGLAPGMRLLDVGCGWGGMVRHAAKHYGVRATGVTLSASQARWAQEAIEADGLGHLAEVRHGDYRDIADSGFDAVSSIGLTEHIGEAEVPGYFRFLHRKLVPGGRLLNHCITKVDNSISARSGPFIERYVFPDGELESPGQLMSMMHDNGFEVRHTENLREHYVRTLAAWCANLEANWAGCVREAGQGTSRVWRLYMSASRLSFQRNEIQLHQMLGVKLDGTHSRMPLRPDW